MKKIVGSIMLFMAAVIWGLAFTVQDVAMDYVTPLTFNFSRYFVSAVFLIPFCFMKLDRPSEEARSKRKMGVVPAGIICGVILSVASIVQQLGIEITSDPAKAGFITALYIVLVPIAGLLFGKRPKFIVWCAVAAAVAALYLILAGKNIKFSVGDLMLLLCAVCFTGHIIFIDFASPGVNGVVLSCVQFATVGVISLILAFIFEKPDLHIIFSAWKPILYAGVLSGGVGYTFQILGQKRVEPAAASLLMSLESVFSVVGSLVILHSAPTLRMGIGFGVMFIAILMVQLGEFDVIGKKRKREE